MIGVKLLVILTVLSFSFEKSSAATDKVICYHGSWSYYRTENGKFTVNDINPRLCTHLIYSFIGIKHDGNLRFLDEWLEINLNNLVNFNALKKVNPNLKTLFAVGGWSEGSINFSKVAADPAKRAVFIQSALKLVQKYGFDGLDLDWEYPSQRGGSNSDKLNFATLLQELRVVWDQNGLLLTAAVAATGPSVDLSYDVPALSRYLDIINVMAYDLHGAWDGVTGQNAPLFASSIDTDKQLNVDAAIRGWISRGCDPQKIALGLAVYGRSYTLVSSANANLGAPVSNVGVAGKHTCEGGMLGYNEICELQKEGGWTEVWDDQQKVPYMSKGDQWIGFDNSKSIKIKVEYAKVLKLGGVMIWSIETEDFRGICGHKYPILNTINQALHANNENEKEQEEKEDEKETDDNGGGAGSGSDNQEKEEENEQTKSENQTESNEKNTSATAKDIIIDPVSLCKESGYVRDPNNCALFYYCLGIGNSFVPLRQGCISGLHFDSKRMLCDYPTNVQC